MSMREEQQPAPGAAVQHETLPDGFEGLAPFVAWNLATPDERQSKRRRSSSEELATFYNGVLPHMEAILAILGKYQLGELPPQYRALFNLALAQAEVAPHAELYGGDPAVPHSFVEDRMIAAHGRQETWRGLPPMGQAVAVDGARNRRI